MKLLPQQQRWIDALRSGQYEQADSVLFNGTGYCCLGVACVLEGIEPVISCNARRFEFDGRIDVAPPTVLDSLHLFSETGHISLDLLFESEDPDDIIRSGAIISRLGMNDCLAGLNDTGWTFEQIANFIEENPDLVFSRMAE